MANANRNVHVQNEFMGRYRNDLVFTLSQIQIQDLEMIAETYNIPISSLEYVNSHASNDNMQAIHGNMPANHGNIPTNHSNRQEILGNMQSVQGYMQAIDGNVHPIPGIIQATNTNIQATHVDDEWQINLLDRMGGEEL